MEQIQRAAEVPKPGRVTETMSTPLTGLECVKHAIGQAILVDPRFAELPTNVNNLATPIAVVFGRDADIAMIQLIKATSICFDARTYATIPIFRPYAIRDRSKRGGKNKEELWGTPRHDGYFSDDNSLLKRLPQKLNILSSDPYLAGRRISVGWTACHAWRLLPSGKQASSYGVLNSFAPVLTWVPSALSRPTDIEHSPSQTLLKSFAASFRELHVHKALEPYVDRCWSLLGELPVSQEPVHKFEFKESLALDRTKGMYQVAEGLRDVTRPSGAKIVSSRYTAGLTKLDPTAAYDLCGALTAYADSVQVAMHKRQSSSFKPFPE